MIKQCKIYIYGGLKTDLFTHGFWKIQLIVSIRTGQKCFLRWKLIQIQLATVNYSRKKIRQMTLMSSFRRMTLKYEVIL